MTNVVYILHYKQEPLTPSLYKQIMEELYPPLKNRFYGPRYTRKAYFEKRHAQSAVRGLDSAIRKHITIERYIHDQSNSSSQ